MRSVRQENGIPDKERLFVLLRLFHEVVDGLHRFATNPLPKPLVKSVVARISLLPLSGLKRGIPVILQLFHQGRRMLKRGGHGFRLLLGQGPQFFVGPQSQVVNAFTHERAIAPHSCLVRIKPGDDACQRGAANRRGGVAAFINQALAGELIEVGCFEVRMAHEAVVVPALIIAQDKDHVGPVIRLRERAGGDQAQNQN